MFVLWTVPAKAAVCSPRACPLHTVAQTAMALKSTSTAAIAAAAAASYSLAFDTNTTSGGGGGKGSYWWGFLFLSAGVYCRSEQHRVRNLADL